jgi:hypothetical protein
MITYRLRGLCLVAILAGAGLATVHASTVFSRYRDVTLGDSIATVVERLQLVTPQIKVVFERPAKVEEITWRPSRFVSGVAATADPLSDLVLTFYEGRLARMVVSYDSQRTLGLTDADLRELLSSAYGAAMLPSTPTMGTAGALPFRRVLAAWGDDEARVLLWRELHPARVGLLITSVADADLLADAVLEGTRLEAEAAPAREVTRRAAAAAAVAERDAQIRSDNKAKFKP